MADSAQFIFMHGLFYGLGALGLFSIGALPLRTYMIARRLRAALSPTWQVLTIVAAAGIAVALATQFLFQLAKCLLVSYQCSASAAGGWLNAAFLGAIYVGFELAAFVVVVAGRRRVAT